MLQFPKAKIFKLLCITVFNIVCIFVVWKHSAGKFTSNIVLFKTSLKT